VIIPDCNNVQTSSLDTEIIPDCNNVQTSSLDTYNSLHVTYMSNVKIRQRKFLLALYIILISLHIKGNLGVAIGSHLHDNGLCTY
jgi:hypothetical protein